MIGVDLRKAGTRERKFNPVLRSGCDRLHGNGLGLMIGSIIEPLKTDNFSGLAVFNQNDPFPGFFTNLIWRRFFPIHGKRLSYGVVDHTDMGHTNSPSLTLSLK
jgi:hypothetical protein